MMGAFSSVISVTGLSSPSTDKDDKHNDDNSLFTALVPTSLLYIFLTCLTSWTLKFEAAVFLEMLVYSDQTTQHHIQEYAAETLPISEELTGENYYKEYTQKTMWLAMNMIYLTVKLNGSSPGSPFSPLGPGSPGAPGRPGDPWNMWQKCIKATMPGRQ
jgi:hypothetical protein